MLRRVSEEERLARLKKRSVEMEATDEKYNEMKHYLSSHSHMERTLQKARRGSYTATEEESQANQEPDERDRFMKKEDPLSATPARKAWREAMDSSVRSLLCDLQLSWGDELKEFTHSCRCNHLDRSYEWFVKHGGKSVRKERKAPPYLTFGKDEPAWPGSLRFGANQEQRRPVLSKSSLILAGSLNLANGITNSTTNLTGGVPGVRTSPDFVMPQHAVLAQEKEAMERLGMRSPSAPP